MPDEWVAPESVGQPYSTSVRGSLTFRGNPTRTWYGGGPVPRAPEVQWSFRIGCSASADRGESRNWCGTGWTGQPAVFDRDGRTWVVFGAYDRKVHFLHAESGERILADVTTGDIIKGSVTIDPDGYPLVYSGSRDNLYRVIAIDRSPPVVLWTLSANAVSPTLWNNDWDGSALVLRDHLIEGGENSQLHVVKLNRAYGPDGLVAVKPTITFNTPGWDAQLLRDLGDREVSIESSVAVFRNTVYFANSGGLVQGWDLRADPPTRTFRYWVGDDTDASVVVDESGALYVAVEYERGTARSREVGQVLKLDPSRTGDPRVWSWFDDIGPPGRRAKAGLWATPALHRDVVYVATNGGRLVALDRQTGAQRWAKQLAAPTWQSPVVVDNVLIEGDCAGMLRAWDVADTTIDPPELWAVKLPGCIESTPTVWGGWIYVGTRSGELFALSDPRVQSPAPRGRQPPATRP